MQERQKDLGRSNGEFCNKTSLSVFLSVEFVCWLPYKSQVQNPKEFKTLQENDSEQHARLPKFTISAFLNF